MYRRIKGNTITYGIKLENIVASENYFMDHLKLSEQHSLVEVEPKGASELLIKASISLHLGKGHVLYVKKEALAAYEVDNTLISLKKLIIQDTTIEIFEIVANYDTEILIDGECSSILEFSGLAKFTYVLGWVDNLPCFKVTPGEYKLLFLEWKVVTNIILQV